MSENNVVQFTGGAVTTTALADRLAALRARTGDARGSGAYLNFRKGEWDYGAAKEEPDPNGRWAINPASFRDGMICWDTRKGVTAVLGEFWNTDASRTPEPIENGKWSEQWSVQMACVSGDDKGVQVEYKTNSVGGTNELKRMRDAILERLETHHDTCVPIVTLDVDSYPHAEYGKIHVPVLEIVDWAAMGQASYEAPEKEEEEEETPAPRRRRRK